MADEVKWYVFAPNQVLRVVPAGSTVIPKYVDSTDFERAVSELSAIRGTMDWDIYTCPDGSIDVYLHHLEASGKRVSVGLANIESDGSVDSSLFGRPMKTKMRGVFGGFDAETGDPFPSSIEREAALRRELAAWKRAVDECGLLADYSISARKSIHRRVAELMKDSEDAK